MDNSPKKSLGQHWLSDPKSLSAIVEAAKVRSGDYVLEIGPGTGELTHRLLESGARVMALEIDESLIPRLQARFADYQAEMLTVKLGDIRTFNLSTLPHSYKIVANIPYYLSAYLLRLLSESPTKPAVASLLVQKEVAERVSASPGQMSLLSVACQIEYEVNLGEVIAARLFMPPPKVDSQILILNRRQSPLFQDDKAVFFRLVRSGFSQRRKTLLNTLSASLRLDREPVTQLLNQAGISPNARAQSLTLAQWHKLCDVYTKAF